MVQRTKIVQSKHLLMSISVAPYVKLTKVFFPDKLFPDKFLTGQFPNSCQILLPYPDKWSPCLQIAKAEDKITKL